MWLVGRCSLRLFVWDRYKYRYENRYKTRTNWDSRGNQLQTLITRERSGAKKQSIYTAHKSRKHLAVDRTWVDKESIAVASDRAQEKPDYPVIFICSLEYIYLHKTNDLGALEGKERLYSILQLNVSLAFLLFSKKHWLRKWARNFLFMFQFQPGFKREVKFLIRKYEDDLLNWRHPHSFCPILF